MSSLKKLTKLYSLKNYKGYKTGVSIVVLGVGGTGGYLIPTLTRYMYLLRDANLISALTDRFEDINLLLIDGDAVEQKNLVRQNFVSEDIGKNKAEVLAERYSKHFGVDITCFPEYVSDSADLVRIFKALDPNHVKVIIGCVDNNKTRLLIHKATQAYTKTNEPVFWIDAGNEEHHGQVVCGYTHPVPLLDSMGGEVSDEFPLGLWSGANEFGLPTIVELHPEVLKPKDKLPTDLSCAERAVSAPQTIFVNQMAAVHIMNFLQQILNGEPISHFAVYFSTRTNNARVLDLTEASINQVANSLKSHKKELEVMTQ